jgi:hypothetical protein
MMTIGQFEGDYIVTKLLAIDLGRGFTKGKTLDGEFRFISLIDQAVDLTIYQKLDGDMILEEEDGNKYFVGDLAFRDGKGMKRKPTTEEKATDDTMRLFYAGLYRANIKSGSVYVMTGVPKTNIETGDHQRLKSRIEGTHRFKINGEKCEVQVLRCWVTVEGGIIYNYLQTLNMIPDNAKKVRVIDPGAYTTNFATYTKNLDGKWIYTNGESGTIARGWENDGKSEEDVEVNPKQLADMLSSNLQRNWKNNDFPTFLAGGGALKLEEPMKKYFPHIHAITDSQMANVRGYYSELKKNTNPSRGTIVY